VKDALTNAKHRSKNALRKKENKNMTEQLIEKLSDDAPELVALRAAERKYDALAADREREKAELDKATQRYLSNKKPSQQSKIEAEADELITGIAKSADQSLKDLSEIDHKIAVLDVAVEKQREEVSRARSKYSVALCRANRRRYIEIERRIAQAVQALAEANEIEMRFLEGLCDAGCSTIPFRPMRMAAVGVSSDPQSRAALHRREVEEFCPDAL
jgi:hypothetical protein